MCVSATSYLAQSAGLRTSGKNRLHRQGPYLHAPSVANLCGVSEIPAYVPLLQLACSFAIAACPLSGVSGLKIQARVLTLIAFVEDMNDPAFFIES